MSYGSNQPVHSYWFFPRSFSPSFVDPCAVWWWWCWWCRYRLVGHVMSCHAMPSIAWERSNESGDGQPESVEMPSLSNSDSDSSSDQWTTVMSKRGQSFTMLQITYLNCDFVNLQSTPLVILAPTNTPETATAFGVVIKPTAAKSLTHGWYISLDLILCKAQANLTRNSRSDENQLNKQGWFLHPIYLSGRTTPVNYRCHLLWFLNSIHRLS